MDTGRIVLGCILAAITLALGSYTGFAARCKGSLLNNSWLWASPEERKKLDLPKEYRQTAIVFAFLTSLTGMLTLYAFTGWHWPLTAEAGLTVAVLIYAIVSSMRK